MKDTGNIRIEDIVLYDTATGTEQIIMNIGSTEAEIGQAYCTPVSLILTFKSGEHIEKFGKAVHEFCKRTKR